ncbi:hypothetical protein LDENG_00253350 [Lucifuga dentata]|nr:hypothetical protein LDENG_00253350 [Lucifuga dentata]
MAESREVPSGNVYRQLFDAQVQLSRSLLARQRALRNTCLSAQDSNSHSSTSSRVLSFSSSRGQQLSGDSITDDVITLPDTVVVQGTSDDVIKWLTGNRQKKHNDALEELNAELTILSQHCESQIRKVCLHLVSCLDEVDLRFDALKARMDHVEALEHLSQQEVYGLWEEVEQEVKQRKSSIRELDNKLTEQEAERSDRLRALLKKHCHLLEKIGFMSSSDLHSLIHNEVTMINQALLANRRSKAHLMLHLLEENLHREALLHLHWEDWLSCWRRRRVNQVIGRFREVMSREEAELVPVHQTVDQMRRVQREMTQQRCDIIYKLCSLIPPTCSTHLVSDWFNQLTDINEKIDCLHVDSMHQLRCCYEHCWQDHLAEMERCREVLSALELSEEEVQDIVSSQLLPLIGQCQSQAEDRLAELDASFDSLADGALSISSHVLVLMRGAALLWEMHSRCVERREEELERQLDDLRQTQEQEVQRKKVQLDVLHGLRQESSEEALKRCLEKTIGCLQEVTDSFRQCVSEQLEVLDCFPSVILEELHMYSSNLSNYYHLSNTYSLSPEELKTLYPSINLVCCRLTETTKQDETKQKRPISFENDAAAAQASRDWLTEVKFTLRSLSL